MSTDRGGRGGTGADRGRSRARGASPFTTATTTTSIPGKTRSPFAPRGKANNQVRFDTASNGRGNGAAGATERGGRGGHRGGRGRGGGAGAGGKSSNAPVVATRSPLMAPTPSPSTSPLAQGQGQGQGQGQAQAHRATRFDALKLLRDQERALAIAQGFLADPLKPRVLADAITPVGTCPDMCPEFERVERINNNETWAAEKVNDEPVEHRMVKKFRRSAAGVDEQLPSDLRPPTVLKKTIDYLFDQFIPAAPSLASAHHFVWDRTRAIRNDFSIQQVSKPADVQIAIECFERIARFHILSLHQLALPEKPYDKYDYYQEREQLDRTLLSLMQYYDDSRGRLECKNEAEFRAYLILFQIQNPTPDLGDKVNTWPVSVRSNPRVKTALELNAAASNTVDSQGPLKPRTPYPVAREDWCEFFDLVRSAKVSYLMACAAEIYFKLVRRIALNSIWRAFKGPDFSLSLMTDLLGFDAPEQTEEFCQHFGFVFKTSDSGDSVLDLGSVQGKTLPQETAGLQHQTFSDNLVEIKRMGRSISAVIDGYSVADAQASGFIDESYDSQMDDSQVEDSQTVADEDEDEDSLFVPLGPPKSTFGTAPTSSPFAGAFGAAQQSASEAPAPSIFAQVKSQSAGFGQPSGPAAAASSGFNFGKPSVAAPSEPVEKSPSMTFGQPTATSNPNPFSSPFNLPKPQTPSDNKPVEKVASPFAFAKPQAQSDKKPSDAVASPFAFAKPAAAAEPTSSPQSFPATKNSQTSLFHQPRPETSSSPSLFSSSAVQQDTASKPSFSFTSTNGVPSQPSKSTSLFTTTSDGESPATSKTPTPPPVEAPVATKKPFSFTTTPPTPTLTSPKNDVPNVASKPSSLFSNPSQPKKPSPLFQSFCSDEGSEASPSESPFAAPSSATAVSTHSSTTTAGPLVAEKPLPVPPKPVESKDEILNRLARQVVLDVNRGLVRQFIEYQASATIMSVYEELYTESNRALADTFRTETLSYRYGKRWREICWRRRLARQGRERRKRVKKDQSVREMKKKLAAEKDAVDDFLRSTSQAKQMDSSLRSSYNNTTRTSSVGPVAQVDHASAGAKRNSDRSPATQTHDNKRLKSSTKTRESEVVREQTQESAPSPRSSFLGFSMLGPHSRPVIPSTPSRSNYFRLKAMGINPAGDQSQPRKRIREESEGASSELSPPAKRSQTPPSVVDHKAESLCQEIATESFRGTTPMSASKPLSKAQQDDEALFARARAARQAMAESGAWYRSEVEKEETARDLEMSQSLSSSSMDRARRDARLRASQVSGHTTVGSVRPPDVPAYRLRESRFVPRESYNRAIERARENIKSRSRSPSQLTPLGNLSPLPSTIRSPSRTSQISQHAQIPSYPSIQETQSVQGYNSLVELDAVHQPQGNSAWNYDPAFFADSINPVSSEVKVNGHADETTMRSWPLNNQDGALLEVNEFIDLGSDDEESEGLQQNNKTSRENGSETDSEVYDGEADEEDIGGYAGNPEDYEEEFSEEDEEVEDYDEEEDEDEEELSDEDDQAGYANTAASLANAAIKAGTGTAEDAFELSD